MILVLCLGQEVGWKRKAKFSGKGISCSSLKSWKASMTARSCARRCVCVCCDIVMTMLCLSVLFYIAP